MIITKNLTWFLKKIDWFWYNFGNFKWFRIIMKIIIESVVHKFYL